MKKIILFLSFYAYPIKIHDVEILDIKELASDEDLICNGTIRNLTEGRLSIHAKTIDGVGTLIGKKVVLVVYKNNFSGTIQCSEGCDIYLKLSDSTAIRDISLPSGLWQFKGGNLIR